MKIGVHAKVLSQEKLTGIGYYTFNLLKALLRVDKKNEYLFFSPQPLQHPIPKGVLQLSKPSIGFSYLGFRRGFVQNRCDLAFIPKEVFPPLFKKPKVLTAYDLYYLKCSRKHVPAITLLHYQLAAKYYLKNADKIIAISNDTKRDLIELCQVPEN